MKQIRIVLLALAAAFLFGMALPAAAEEAPQEGAPNYEEGNQISGDCC